MRRYVIGNQVTADEFRRVRALLQMTQKEFAAFSGSAVRTVENWESGKSPVRGPVVPLVEILLRWPELAEKLALPEPRGGLRLWYMYKSTVCTVIDADEAARRVKIRNYIDHTRFRAFGANTDPTYEDFEAFLASRCFSRRSRNQLRKLGIPHYDPLLIIEKTEGRKAGDDFWLRIERTEPEPAQETEAFRQKNRKRKPIRPAAESKSGSAAKIRKKMPAARYRLNRNKKRKPVADR